MEFSYTMSFFSSFSNTCALSTWLRILDYILYPLAYRQMDFDATDEWLFLYFLIGLDSA